MHGYDFGGYKDFYEVFEKQQKLLSSRSPEVLRQFSKRNAKIKLGEDVFGSLALLTPKKCEIPPKQAIEIVKDVKSPRDILKTLSALFDDASYIAVDLETKGTKAHSNDDFIVGLGVSSHRSIVYFDFLSNSQAANWAVLEWLETPRLKLIAHNVFFDAAFLLSYTGKWLNWQVCTYGMYKQLANEGFNGQSWGLKAAQVQLLEWEAKGDVELDEWLVTNKYITTAYKKGISDEELLASFNKGDIRVDKSQMWRAPPDILGYYCGLDCAATYQLFASVFLPAVKGQVFEDKYLAYHEMFLTNVRLLVEQQLSGISIDKPRLMEYYEGLEDRIKGRLEDFLTNDGIGPLVEEFNRERLSEIEAKEPTKYKKRPKLGVEPDKLTKAGKPSKSWEKWDAKRIKLETEEPEVSKSWDNWNDKYQAAKDKMFFNPGSNKHLDWLFYEKLNFPVVVKTDTGNPSVGVKALPGFGRYGKLLKSYKDLIKEEGYVKSCITHLQTDKQGASRIHPQFRAPGTLTCRLAGSGGINIQQIPKSKGYLSCWRPEKGRTWVQNDHSALEQVVLAELSRDEALWKIYGPEAKANDIYLFNGSQLPIIGEKIIAAGYNPDNPDKEAIAHVKKVCKKERGISKVITLGCLPENTLIKTLGGLKKIIEVTDKDIIWDGEKWVPCSGAAYMGERECHRVTSSVWSTDNHEFLTSTGWKTERQLREVSKKNLTRPGRAPASWSDVWKMAGQLFSVIFKGKI